MLLHEQKRSLSPKPLAHIGDLRPYYVLRECPCPYLPDQLERKLLTELTGPDAATRYSLLSRAGFRRSHHYAYRPACEGCMACVPVRVVVSGFMPGKSLKRIWRRNSDLEVVEMPGRATKEQFELFDLYLQSRHGDGEMVGMTFADYRTMVEESHLQTRLAEFRDQAGDLVAVCLLDWLQDGASAVYSFFRPDLGPRSLGNHMVLWLIEETRRRGQQHVYLGYWIAESRKMAYKIRFQPMQGLGPNGWELLRQNPSA